ncbi:arginase [Alteromonas sp. a30]|nr:arginase [Alteromonas sp. a30]
MKIGQQVCLAQPKKAWDEYSCRYALVGIPEDIGPRANLGFAGATGAWQAFLKYFLNLQSNRFLSGQDILILGEVETQDIQATPNDTEALRRACETLDLRVFEVLSQTFKAGLIPIIIGGGHNNAFPIMQACHQATNLSLAVANLDPHSDFRAMEGRHSGNPFRYAHDAGFLKRYAVLGLHEQKNNQDSLDALKACGFPWFSIQQTHWSNSHNFDQCLEQVGKYLLESGLPVGVELDLDAITNMPTSAMTAAGVSLTDALYYVDQMARLPQAQYLHLAEGAPQRHAISPQEGERIVGQSLAELVSIFVKAKSC